MQAGPSGVAQIGAQKTRMKTDPLDLSKDGVVDAMIDNAQSKAHVAMFGKAAYEAYRSYYDWMEPWARLDEFHQVVWVGAAQAVLDEARKAGWL